MSTIHDVRDRRFKSENELDGNDDDDDESFPVDPIVDLSGAAPTTKGRMRPGPDATSPAYANSSTNEGNAYTSLSLARARRESPRYALVARSR